MKAKRLSKKLISIILTIMMLATMLPATSVHTHAAVDNSGVTLEYSGEEVTNRSLINNESRKVKVYTITEDGEYVLKTSAVTEYGVTIIIGNGVNNVSLVLDNVNIDSHMPVMPDMVQGVNYNNSICAGLAIYNSGNELTDLEVNLNGSNIIGVATDRDYETSAMLVRGCNVNFYGNSDSYLLLNNNSAEGTAYGFINLTKDGYVGEAVPFEEAPYLVMNSDTNISVDVQQGYGIIAVREIDMYSEARISVHSKYTAIQSYVDENVLENGYFGLYVDNSIISVDSMGAGICINNGGAYFCGGSDVSINSSDTALGVNSGNITFEDINNAYINSTNGYGLALNDSSLYVEFFSKNVSIYGVQGAIKGMPDYLSSRGYVGDTEIITLHSDDGVDYSEFTDDATTKKYAKTSTIAHTHDFGEDYYESDVAGNHYMLCDCGEMSVLEECTYSFSHFEAAPGIENDGIKVYYCDYCNARKDVTIPAHDCNAYTNFKIDENGNHYGDCTYEGCERYIDEPHNLELLEELDENSHKHICAACGYFEVEDHLFVEFKFIDEATHEAYCECGYTGDKPHEYFEFSGNNDGVTHTGYCYCGAEVTGEHNWGDWEEAADGSGTFHTCKDCYATEYCSHEWSEWYGISNLQHQRTCEICGTTKDSRHTWDDWTDNGTTHSHDCSGCGWRITEEHDYINIWDDENGTTHTAYCTCGKGITSEHDWSPWIDTEDGQHKRECNDCGAEEIGEHNWGEWESLNEESHQRFCKDCSAREEASHNLTDNWVDIGDEGHRLGCVDCEYGTVEPHEIHENIPSEDGKTHTGYCFCGAVITVPHTWGECIESEDGHTRLCTGCTYTVDEAHNLGEYSKDETNHTAECSDCHAIVSDRHSYGNYEYIDGENHTSDCSVCGYTQISAHKPNLLGYKDNGDGTHSATCGKCSKKYYVEHTYVCGKYDEEKHTLSCDECDAWEFENHNWSDWEITEDGKHHRECFDCGYEQSGNHEYSDYEYVDGATHQRNCSVCDYTEVTAHKPNLLGYKDNGDGTHSATCGKCSKKYYVEHTYVCGKYDEEKHTLSCDECDAWEFENHNWSDWEITKDGKHHRECLDCGYEQSDNHTFGNYEYVDNQTHERICSVCEYIESEKHRYHSIKGCTDNGDGTHTYECTRCSEKITVEHTLTYDKYNSEKHVITCGDCKLKIYEIHNWSEWELSIDGSRNRYCLDCGEQQSCYHENKTYTESDGQKHKVTCDNCGWCYSEFHEYEEFISQGDGTHKSACRCGYWFMEDHFYFCEDNGNGTHTGTCGCGDVVTESHSYDFETVILREPTEGRPGSKREYCSCGAYKNSSFVSYYDANGDDVIDEMDYQLLINEILQDANEQSGTAEYDEIIKYDLDGDGCIDVIDASIMALVVNGHKSIWEVNNLTRGDYDFDGVSYSENDIIGICHILLDIDSVASTLSTAQKYAADLNYDGILDDEDLFILEMEYGWIDSVECEDNAEIFYRWGNSYTTCTATAICTICNKKVAVETVNSVQNADGSYTATFANPLLGTKTFKKTIT